MHRKAEIKHHGLLEASRAAYYRVSIVICVSVEFGTLRCTGCWYALVGFVHFCVLYIELVCCTFTNESAFAAQDANRAAARPDLMVRHLTLCPSCVAVLMNYLPQSHHGI